MLINSTTVKSLDLVDGSKLTFDIASAKMIDVCITTPLFVSEYKNGINLGLVRMLNNNTNVGFGKGTNLNVCYKLAKTNDTTLVLTHPTFEQEQFVLDDDASTFKSTISDRYITKTAACYTLYDSNTEIEFIEMHDDLKQYYITVKGQNSYKLLFVYNEDKLWGIGNDNELAESVGFIYDSITGNCTSIVSGKKMDASSDDVTQIGKAELTYTNNIVSQVSIKMHNKTAIKRKSIFTATTTQIVVSDGISSITNIIKLGKLSPSNKYYVKELHIDNQKLLVTYNDYKTTLLLKVNKTTNDEVEVNKEEYFFNKNYELSFVKVNDRIVKAFNYELNERHRLRGYSKELYVKPELNGEYYTFDSYKHWSNHTVQTTTDPNCPASTVVNRITFDYYDEDFDDPSLQFTFNQPGTKLDVINVLIWYRTNQTITNLYYKVEANLNIVKSSGTFTKTTMFDTIYLNLFNNEWQFAILTLQAGEDFEKVCLNFKPNTYGIILDVHMALYKNSFTTIYRYDRDGKIEATLTGKDYSFYKFNQDNQLMLSKNTVNSYDGNGRVIQSVSPKKVYNTTTYSKDSLSTINILKAKNEIMYNAEAYDDKEILKANIDTNGCAYYYKYDEYKRNTKCELLGKMNYIDFSRLMLPFETPSSEILQTTKVNYVSEDTINFGNTKTVEICEGEEDDNPAKLNYQYDTSQLLTEVEATSNNIQKSIVKYEYDEKNRTNKIYSYYGCAGSSSDTGLGSGTPGPGISITPPPGQSTVVKQTLYQCTYDDMGNIKSYNYGDSSKNVSYEYEETDRTILNNVKKIKYCNQDKYGFEYSNDGKGLLSKVTSHDTTAANGEELSINYEYDNNKLVAIKIKGDETTYHTNELKYNQNNDAFIERNITGESVLETEYLDSSKIAFDSINGFEYSLLCEQDDDLYWTMFIDRKIEYSKEYKDSSYLLLGKSKTLYPELSFINMQDISYNYNEHGLRLLEILPNTTPYYFEFNNNDNHCNTDIYLGNKFSLFFCTKINNLDKRLRLLSFMTSTSIKSFELWYENNEFTISTWSGVSEIYEDKKAIPVYNTQGNVHFIATNVTQNIIDKDRYEIIIDVYVDGEKKVTFTSENSKELDKIDFSNIVDKVDSLSELSTIILNTSKHLSEDKIKEYTNRLKAIYNKGESYPENFNITLDHYENYDYDTIALHNTFESKNGLKPIKQLNNPGIVNIQDNFEFVDDAIDTNVGNYAYAMKKQTLKYNIPLSNSGMIGVRFKTITNKSATFLHLQSENGFSFVVTTFNNKILSRFRGTQIYEQEISNDWNSAIITWSKQIQSASLDEGSCQIKIYINGSLIYSSSFMSYYSIVPEISLGKNLADTSTDNETIGYIDKVIYNDLFISDVTAANLHNEMSNHYYLKDTFDDFGRKASRIVKTRSNSKLENIYEYKENPSSNVSTETNILNKETLKIDNIEKENRRYTYDSLGNVNNITITDNFHSSTISTSYTYGKGQLTKEFVAVYPGSYTDTIEYSYDGRGNITSIKRNGSTSKTFEYSTNGLLLTKVNDSTITYDGLFPKYVKDENGNTIKELEFEGRRLKSLIDYNDNKKYCYFYNASGLREQKKVYNKTTNVLLSSVDYYYNSRNLLVSEVRKTYNSGTLSTTYDIMYMYDSNGMLYAFKYNGDVFYYVRDALGNINHIVNQDGELESSYTYEAYGSHTVLNAQGSTSTSSTLIGNINPFRYKGYYYDVETQLFYCNSRYYSPELCRFISPDSIEYLDPESINGLNLYCYCMNNPIMYADPSGHMPEWLQWTLGGLIVVGAIALSICTAGLATPIATAVGGGLFGAIVGGAVAGAIGGAIAGFGVSIGTQAITNGFENINWSDVGKSTASGAISGFIAGGVFGGIKYAYSAKSLANSVSGLSKAQSSLDNAWKPLSNVKNLANMPFSGANIARTVGQAAANYNAAYTNLIFAGVNNTIAKLAFTGLYAGAQFGLKQLIGYGINQIW